MWFVSRACARWWPKKTEDEDEERSRPNAPTSTSGSLTPLPRHVEATEVVIVEIVVEIRKTKVLDSVAEREVLPPPDFVPGQHPPRELLPFAAVFVPPILNSHVLWKSIQAYNPLGEPTSVQPPQHGLSKSCCPRACQATFHYATPTSPNPNHVQAPTMRTHPTFNLPTSHVTMSRAAGAQGR